MAIAKQELHNILQTAFHDAEVLQVVDTVGDNNHYDIHIISQQFNDISLVKQHQLVYNALGDIVGTRLHAVSLKTQGTK